VVLVVEDVHEVGVEGVHVLLRKGGGEGGREGKGEGECAELENGKLTDNRLHRNAASR